MTEDEHTADDSTGINRRNVLRTVGAAGIFATGAAGVAAANGNLTQADEAKLLTGEEKLQLARDLANTSAFQELAQRARADGARVRTDADGIIAGYATGEDFAREIVEYDLENVPEADEGSIIIGRNPTTGGIEVASLDYYYEASDGVLEEVRRYEPSTETDRSQVQTASAAGGATVIPINTEAIRDARDGELDLPDSPASGTTAIEPQIEVTGCSACEFAAGQICTIGCGAAGGFICGFLGITIPVAGLSCLGLVEVVCTVADEYSGCGDAVAEEACSRVGLC